MRTSVKIVIATLSALIAIATISVFATQSINREESDTLQSENDTATQQLEVSDFPAESVQSAETTYPTAWLACAIDGIPAEPGTPVELMYAPDMDIRPHCNGHQADGQSFLPPDPALAVIEAGDNTYHVDPNMLLVNLPDLIPNAIYDIRYAYDTPSRSGGEDIPGLTGTILPGYASQASFDAYLGRENRPAPAAYQTALKLMSASDILDEKGYRLVVWDIYRPHSASRHISDMFADAYESNPKIQSSVGNQWGLSWYAADGTSGHNYGTDVDVSLADSNGKIISMPSDFDAFDESAHLTDAPMNSTSISKDKYRQAVKDNDACMDLHDAFVSAGFAELASEWWHFADKESENAMRMLVGNEGLDFEARLVR